MLTASNVCGSKSDSVRINSEDCSCSFYLPNAFTPNGDGLNDEYHPVYNCRLLNDYRLVIFNRWGEMIFESANSEKGWDGTTKNLPTQQDIYVVKLTYKSKNNAEKIFYEKVALIR